MGAFSLIVVINLLNSLEMLKQIICRPISSTVLVRSRHLVATSQHASRAFHVTTPVGSDGAIKDAGGKMAQRGATKEEQCYRKIQAEQLKKLKSQHKDHVQNAQQEIKRLQSLIDKHKEDIEIGSRGTGAQVERAFHK